MQEQINNGKKEFILITDALPIGYALQLANKIIEKNSD